MLFNQNTEHYIILIDQDSIIEVNSGYEKLSAMRFVHDLLRVVDTNFICIQLHLHWSERRGRVFAE